MNSVHEPVVLREARSELAAHQLWTTDLPLLKCHLALPCLTRYPVYSKDVWNPWTGALQFLRCGRTHRGLNWARKRGSIGSGEPRTLPELRLNKCTLPRDASFPSAPCKPISLWMIDSVECIPRVGTTGESKFGEASSLESILNN